MKTFVFVLLLLLAIGCKKSDTAGHDHGPGGHSHAAEAEEEKTAQITIWSERFEIFAEHKAAVVNKPTRFITHVTDVKTGEARRSGLVKFIFSQGADRFEHPQAAPERPGIYIPAITFPKEGDWSGTVIIPGETEATVNLGTIKVFANADAAKRAGFPEPPEGISFLKEQQWRILTKHEAAQKRSLVQRVPLHATVIPAPGSKVLVHPSITGTLVAGEKTPGLGAAVKGGDVIAFVQPAFGELSSKLIEGEAESIRTKAALDQAQAAFERTKRLFEQQAKSEREMKEAEVALRAAQASHEAAAAVQKLYKGTGTSFDNGVVRIGITAPIDGVIDRVLAAPGARVTPDEPVFSIINSAAAYIQAQVPESRLTQIDPKLGGRFIGAGQANASAPIKFVALGQEIDPATRTVPLTFAFESSKQNIPLGSVGTLEIGSKQAVDALAIPADAVVEEDGIPIVFVQVSGETYQKRDVTLGVRDGPWIEIKSGVVEGERVATEGAYPILLSTKSGTIPAHGHAH
jgi:membrane fusion protein, heavy metal efflux system